MSAKSLEPVAGDPPPVPLPPVVEPSPPLFEVIIPSALAGVTVPAYHFKLWADGKTQGFDQLAATRRMAVVNRTPQLLEMVALPMRDFVDDLAGLIDRLAGDAATPNDPAKAGGHD